jgi:tetratricopeptide (TPR) repeat protein
MGKASKRKLVAVQKQGFGAKNFAAELHKAAALLGRKQWEEARTVLDNLHKAYPQQKQVLEYLVQVHFELNDLPALARVGERLLEVSPNDEYIRFTLAAVYLQSMHPLMALQMARAALERSPDHEQAPEMRRLIASLEDKVDDLLVDLELEGEDGVELAILHERGQAYLEQGEYDKAREVEEELIRRRPDFVSAHNNLSLIGFVAGDVEGAIATCEKVLELDPGNIHALSNLIRFCCLSGRWEQAKAYGERLKASQSSAWDPWTKKVEGLTYLGDDAGVLEVYEQAQQSGELESGMTSAMFHHVVAVALARSGQLKQARQEWQRALKRSPGYALAQENLNDLKRPVGERHAPWSFHWGDWIMRKAVDDLVATFKTLHQSSDSRQVEQVTQTFLTNHPEVAQLIPVLLERGDPQGREFAFRFATTTKTPAMLEALKEFALSQHGPDGMRHQAAIAASEAGLLPTENVRMWLNGEWREILLIAFEFHTEVPYDHSRKVNDWLANALGLLKKYTIEDAKQAEVLLRKALEVEPEAVDLLNNLVVSYQLQERLEEARELLEQIQQNYPDYVLAPVSLAQFHLQNDEIAEAEALLKPMLSRKRFHIDDFASFSNVYLQLLMAQKNPEAAKGWLHLWEQVTPDHPLIQNWKLRLEGPGILKNLSKLGRSPVRK